MHFRLITAIQCKTFLGDFNDVCCDFCIPWPPIYTFKHSNTSGHYFFNVKNSRLCVLERLLRINCFFPISDQVLDFGAFFSQIYKNYILSNLLFRRYFSASIRCGALSTSFKANFLPFLFSTASQLYF